MIGFTKNYQLKSNHHVDKRMLIICIFVIINVFVPYALREIFSHKYIVSTLFGGIRLVLFWSITTIIYCSIEFFVIKRTQ
jgi:hypothetical protein